MRNLRRTLTMGTSVLTVLTAMVTFAPGWALAQTQADEQASTTVPDRSSDEVRAKAGNEPTASLQLTLTTAQLPQTSKTVPPAQLNLAADEATALAVGLRPLAVLDRTSGSVAPQFVLRLPAGVRILKVIDDLDPGVSGSWSCKGAGTTTCVLATDNGSAGRIPNGRLAQAILVLGAPTLTDRGSIGTASASAVVTAPGPDRQVEPLNASASMPVVLAANVPPSVVVRTVPIEPKGNVNAVDLRAIALSDLEKADPSVTLSQVVPSGASVQSVSGDGWTCADTTCTRADSPVGVPSDIVGRFIAAGTDTHISWMVDAAYSGGAYTTSQKDPTGPSADIHTGVTVHQSRAVPDPAQFTVQMRSARGQSLAQGRSENFTIFVRNDSRDSYTPRLSITLPDGVSMKGEAKGWSCSGLETISCTGPNMKGREDVEFPVLVKAGRTAPLGRGAIRIEVDPGDNRAVVEPIYITDAGDPVAGVQIRKIIKGEPRGWGNGELLRARIGSTTSYRVQVPNVGGAPVAAGSWVTFGQKVNADATFSRVDGPGCHVNSAGTRWSCHVKTSKPVAPGDDIAVATVAFVPKRASAEIPFGRVQAKLDSGRGNPSYHGVNFAAVRPEVRLHVLTRLDDGITAGGRAFIRLQVRNDDSHQRVHGLTVTGHLPGGIDARTTRSHGWTCAEGTDVSCTYTGTLDAHARTSAVLVPIVAAPDAKPGVRNLDWQAVGTSPTWAKGEVRARVSVFMGARISAEAVPAVIGQRPPDGRATRVVLNAVDATPDTRVWHHRWTQLCLTAAQRQSVHACHAVRTESVSLSSPDRAVAVAAIPIRKHNQTYVFRVRATDGSAAVDRIVKVRAAGVRGAKRTQHLPTIDARTGLPPVWGSSRAASPTPDTGAVTGDPAPAPAPAIVPDDSVPTPDPTSDRTPRSAFQVTIDGPALQVVKNGDKVTLATSVSGSSGKVTYQWQQVVGTAPALSSTTASAPTFTVPSNTRVVTYQVTATDGSGAVDTDQVTYALNPTVLTQFCNLYSKASQAVQKASGEASKLSASLGGGINAVFNNLKMLGQQCTTASGFTFTATNLSIGGFRVENASGIVTAAGVAISAGELVTPSGWGLPSLSLTNAGLVLAFVGTGAADVTMSGSFSLKTFAFLPLPTGWIGSTRVSFAASSGNTTISLAANGSDTSSATASLSASVSTSGTFNATVTADNLVKIGGAGIDATGSVSYSSTNGIAGHASGSLSGTATLVDGVTIPSLTIAWNPGASPAVTAKGTIAFAYDTDSVEVNATVAYTSTNDWSVTLTGGGTAVWTPVPGLNIQPQDFSGTFAYASGKFDWDVEVDVPNTWNPTPAVAVTGLQMSMASSCPTAVKQVATCPTASAFLAFSGTVTVDSEPVDSFSADALAVIGLGDGGGFVLSASLAGDVQIVDGLDLTGVDLVFSYQNSQPAAGPSVSASTENGFNLDLSGSMTVAGVGNFVNLQVNATSAGWSLAGYTGGIPLGDADQFGSMSSSIFAYSTLPVAITPSSASGIAPVTYVNCESGEPAPDGQLCVGSFYVSGTYSAPGWFTQTIDSNGMNAVGTIEVDPTNGSFDANVAFDLSGNSVALPTGGASGLGLQELFFNLNMTGGNLVVTAGGTANLALPSGYGSNPPQLQVFMQYDVTTSTVSGGFTALDWNDAFGLSDFDLQSLTVALQLNLATMTPGLALSASALLPSSMNSVLSVPTSGIPITAFVDLSLNTPCLGVSIGTEGAGQPTALSVAGGALTATYASLYIAPVGCTIGEDVYAPGYSLAFEGTIFEVGVEVSASIDFEPTLVFNANLDIDSFQVGPLTMEQTTLSIAVNEGVSDSINFSGGFDLFGTNVRASGGVSYTNATSQTTAQLNVSTNGFSLAGFTLSNASIALDVVSSPGDTSIDFNGSGSMSVLGDTLNIRQMEFEVSNNVITSVKANVNTTLNLGAALAFDGAFDFDYQSSPESFSLAAAVDITADGYTLANGTLSITPSCADISATLNVGQMLSASVNGYVIYGANCTVTDALTGVSTPINGDSGAFCVDVDNVDLNLGGFTATGAASLSNNGDATCDGTATNPGVTVGSISATLILGTQDVNNTVSVSGSFSSDGTYNFTGRDNLNIGGFMLDLQVSAANTGSGSSVSGSAQLSVLGNNLAFEGSWTNEGGVPSTTLYAAANPLSLGGWDVGSGSVMLTQTGNDFGMSFAMNLNVGLASMQSIITFNQIDGDILFYTYVDFTLGIPGVASVDAAGSFTNCSTPSCTSPGDYVFSASAGFNFGGYTYQSPPFTINMGGQFGFSVTDGASNQSTAVANVLGVDWWTANDWWTASLTVNQSGVSADVGGAATIYSQEVALQYPCGPWYWVFEDWCSYPVTNWGSVGAYASVNPWSFCFQAFGSPWICL